MNFITLFCQNFVFKINLLHSPWPNINEIVSTFLNKRVKVRLLQKNMIFFQFNNIKFCALKVSNKTLTYCTIFAQ